MMPTLSSARARLALLLLAVAVLGACSSNKPKPAPLEPLKPQIAGREVWSHRIDSITFDLSMAAFDGRFYAASSDGTVVALEAATGREVWRTQIGAKIAAGVGSDGRRTAVVTRNNELVTLDQGKVIWRKPVDSQVATAPLVAGERVFVLGIDRAVYAFDGIDGHLLWTLRRPGDALTLAEAGILLPYRNTLLVGQGAKLAAVDPLKGTVQWETALTTPRGTNEVERLADLVSPASRVDSVFCLRSFQNAVGCIDAASGTLLWNSTTGGIHGVGGDDQFVFGADGSDRVTARKRQNGDLVWTSERFLHRALSAPLAIGRTVVMGDFEGQVHFLARDTGEPLLRLPTDGSAVVGAPVLWENTLLVATRKGGLFAFRPQ
jgi:outer membrane assembly lipoprotein YfgL